MSHTCRGEIRIAPTTHWVRSRLPACTASSTVRLTSPLNFPKTQRCPAAPTIWMCSTSPCLSPTRCPFDSFRTTSQRYWVCRSTCPLMILISRPLPWSGQVGRATTRESTSKTSFAIPTGSPPISSLTASSMYNSTMAMIADRRTSIIGSATGIRGNSLGVRDGWPTTFTRKVCVPESGSFRTPRRQLLPNIRTGICTTRTASRFLITTPPRSTRPIRRC